MNINGYCPNCNMDFDGELVFETFLKQGHQPEKSIQYAESISGYKQHGMLNRWNKRISLYSLEEDRTVQYKCPDCGHIWERK